MTALTALTVRLPNSVHQKVKELALRDEISVNQFIAAVVSEKMASVMTWGCTKFCVKAPTHFNWSYAEFP